MTTLVVLLLGLMFVSVVVSAVLYAKQQAAQQKAAKIKALLQRCQDYENAAALILRIDHRPEIPIAMTAALIEIQKELVSLGLAAAIPQMEEKKLQLLALEEGRLAPASQRVMQNDSQMNSVLEGLRTLGNKLMRLKLRGKMTAETYQSHVEHLDHLKMSVQVKSHEHHGEQLLQADNRRDGVAHLRKARDVYKRSNLAAEVKNEAVRRLTEQIKAAESVQSGRPANNSQDDGDEELDLV